MLVAAPHRGTEQVEVEELGRVAIGVANAGDRKDSWLAVAGESGVAFSGTLDNRPELNAELSGLGALVGGDTPADTLLAAWSAWGEAVFERLRGVFAGAVVRGPELTLYRDHLGFGTLLFRQDGDSVWAASEAKQVVAGAGIQRRADHDALEDIFYGRLDEKRTALSGVERLYRASTARFGQGRPRAVRRYWNPDHLLETNPLGPAEASEGLLAALDLAVKRALTGNDVVQLSGGIDSPAIAALAASHCAGNGSASLAALTAVYPEHASVDESHYVQLIADQLGLRLHTYVPNASPLDDVEHWVDLLDGPVDTISIPEVAEGYRLARELGYGNVLSGELAEYVLTVESHLPGHLALHARWSALADWARAQRSRGRSHRDVLRRLLPSITPAFIAGRYTRLRRRENRPLPPWIDASQVGGLGRRPDLERPARRRWAEAQLGAVRGSGLTLEADALCAASFGLHVRRPFADVDFWEFALSLPAETKFPDAVPKSLVRRAMRGRLPDEVLDRRDKTFFDDHALSTADYDALQRWLLGTDYRVAGVDYDLLAARLEGGRLGVLELAWANDLVRVHAFAAVCS
jgi:asparagine synthase (glutamine-hydrolysing)